jgi:glucose/arabinose dehydrogenase
MKKVIPFALFAIIIAAIAFAATYYEQKYGSPNLSQQNSKEPETSSKAPEQIETFATGLEVPWEIEFLPNEDALVTERTGNLKLISGGQVSTIAKIEDVKIGGEGGLHGVAVDPDFNSNNYIYLYYTYSGNGNNTLNRVVRYKLQNNNLSNEKIIVDQIPGASNHDGGRIKFGPDKNLYITTGDAQEPSLAQNRNSLAGKILRVTREGEAAPGNPFGNRIYSWGHRNSQGITWDNEGRLWSTEHGRSGIQSGLDELNLIEAGKNYGWPEIEGNETRQEMESPVINSGANDTWAPAGAVYLNGSIYFGGLRGRALYEYNINSKELKTHLKNQFGRIRAVNIGPDDLLYISTSNRDGRGNPNSQDDVILKIDPTQL